MLSLPYSECLHTVRSEVEVSLFMGVTVRLTTSFVLFRDRQHIVPPWEICSSLRNCPFYHLLSSTMNSISKASSDRGQCITSLSDARLNELQVC